MLADSFIRSYVQRQLPTTCGSQGFFSRPYFVPSRLCNRLASVVCRLSGRNVLWLNGAS